MTRWLGARFAFGRDLGQRDRLGDQCLERVGVVIVVHALHDGGDALQPHTGVDARARQVKARAVGLLLILHEDEIPDLDETVAVFLGRSWRAAPDMVAMIVEDLGARPARPVSPIDQKLSEFAMRMMRSSGRPAILRQ